MYNWQYFGRVVWGSVLHGPFRVSVHVQVCMCTSVHICQMYIICVCMLIICVHYMHEYIQ